MAKKQNGSVNLVKNGEVKMTVAEQEKPSRAMVPATVAYKLSADLIAQGIEAGDLANLGSTDVTISAKVSPTGKDETLPYEKLIALTAQGAILLSGGKEVPASAKPETGDDNRTDADKASGMCDYFNYGRDLEVKRELRGKLADELEGPSKIIKAAAQKLVDAKLCETLDEAIAEVKERRVKKGLPV